MRNWLYILFGIITILSMTGCQKGQEPANEIRVGTISGPETQLMHVAQNVALETYGLKVKIIEFTDYTLPNQALNDGSIDINMFQHLPYLMAAMKANGYNFVPIAKTFIYPMGIYSYKFDKMTEIKPGSTVAIPNDPTNEARALLLLAHARLIQLKPNVGILATIADIAANPLNLKFKELDAATLPRVLPDVGVAVINSNYAIAAGLSPTIGDLRSRKDAIYVEGRDSLYANLFVVRRADENKPQVHELIAAFQSPQVVAAAQSIFRGNAIQAW